MKKLLALILAIAMTVTLFACGGDGTTSSTPDNQGNASGSTEVTDPNSQPDDGLVQFPTYPEELPRDYDYEVSVTKGDRTITLPVYNASRHDNGYVSTKSGDADSYRRFCEFGFEGEVTISIKVNNPMSSYAILPSSKGIDSTYDNGVVTFKISEPQDLLFRTNDDHNTILSIFAYPLEDENKPKETDPNTLYFKAGLNNLSLAGGQMFKVDKKGVFTIPSGYTVYLEPGALVTARLQTEKSAENVTVCGRGAVLDPRLDRVTTYSYMFYATDSKNTTIRDVKFLDAHCFNLCFTGVDGLTIQNAKILSSEISSDGISFWGTTEKSPNKNIKIDGCYIYNNDNMFVVTSAEQLDITNCILGSGFAVYYPQGPVNHYNMENCDIFRMGDFFRATMNMENDYGDATWNITGKNLRCEDAVTTNAFIYILNQLNGAKSIKLENVSLPKITSEPNLNASKTTNATFDLKNFWIAGSALTSRSQLTERNGEGVTLNLSSGDAASAGAGSYAKAKKTVDWKGEPTIKIGGYTVPFDEVGALEVEGYVPATNVLYALNYTKKGADYIEEKDGVPMLPLSFFKDVMNLEVTTDANGVNIAPDMSKRNMLHNGGFEDIEHSLSTELKISGAYSNSVDWTCFNFAGLFVDTKNANSGKSAMKVNNEKTTGDLGLVQCITPVLEQYGAGTYRFEAFVKLGLSTDVMTTVKLGLAIPGWQLGEKNNLTTAEINSGWTKITHEITLTQADIETYKNAVFFVGGTPEGKNIDFYVDNAALYYLG